MVKMHKNDDIETCETYNNLKQSNQQSEDLYMALCVLLHEIKRLSGYLQANDDVSMEYVVNCLNKCVELGYIHTDQLSHDLKFNQEKDPQVLENLRYLFYKTMIDCHG